MQSSSQIGTTFRCLKSDDLKLIIDLASHQASLPSSFLVTGVTFPDDQVYPFPLILFRTGAQSVRESVSYMTDNQLSAQSLWLEYGQKFKSNIISKSGPLCYSC